MGSNRSSALSRLEPGLGVRPEGGGRGERRLLAVALGLLPLARRRRGTRVGQGGTEEGKAHAWLPVACLLLHGPLVDVSSSVGLARRSHETGYVSLFSCLLLSGPLCPFSLPLGSSFLLRGRRRGPGFTRL